MPDTQTTAADVIASANAARQNLANLERELQDDIDTIDFAAFKAKRPLTPEEIARRRDLRGTQGEVREGFRVLAFVTARRLDETAEVKKLLRDITTINAGLQDDLAKLKKLEKYAKIAAKVADTLAKAAEKLAAAAAKALI